MKSDSPRLRWYDGLNGYYLRLAASGLIPPRWYSGPIPPPELRRAVDGRLTLEIVSHCWNYAHFLSYQLSSLVLNPPSNVDVIMTVYYCTEDEETQGLLGFFGEQKVPGITWNWRALPKEKLFRRSIGRNDAALATTADWIWFTDCDLLFREGCLDSLAEALQGRRDALVFPRFERVTSLLPDDDPLLAQEQGVCRVMDIPADKFMRFERDRASGPLQITHGDVARMAGYCRYIRLYQTPSPVWCKAYEDRAFRWLLKTAGVPLDVDGVYRIRHITKGRYTGASWHSRLRSAIRRLVSWWKEKSAH